MKILGKSIWNPGFGIAVFCMLLISGCSQHQATAPKAAPVATVTPVATNVPAASPAQPFQPYTLIAQPAPKPKVVTHKLRTLKLTLRNKHPYLCDAEGHYYEVGRDKQGHICPIYRDPKTHAVYPLYYDSERDRYYRVVRADNGHYYCGYVGDSDDRFYASNTDYDETDYGTYVSDDRPVIVDSYNTYNIYHDDGSYYGNYPESAPAIHHHHNNDQWLWAIPVIVGAYLLLQPHHHHDHHYYAPSPRTVIVRQQSPGRDFHQAPPFVARQPNDPGHGFAGHPVAFQPNRGQHGPQNPSIAYAGHTSHTQLPVGTYRPNSPGHHEGPLPLPTHPAVKHFVRPAPLHLRTIHAPGRTVVRAEHRLPNAVHRPVTPTHHVPVFVRPKLRRPITHRELTPSPTRRPQAPARSFTRPERHESQRPRPAEHHATPVRHDFHQPPQHRMVPHSAPRPTPPRPEQHSQPHSQPRPARHPQPQNHPAPPRPQNRPAPPRPQNRPSPPQNHPQPGGQHHGNDHPQPGNQQHGNDHPEHKDDHHH